MFERILVINPPKRQSVFLWGARQTGKSSYLKSHFKDSLYYDLLDTHEVMRLTKKPSLLRQELMAATAEQLKYPIIIDEIQKVPELLNEVHWLIENKQVQFILCGSSARKLKTQSTNLLGGRAWPFHFYPFVYPEILEFDLQRALSQGLVPKHYLSETQYIHEYLQAYVDIYLTDEIRNEGLVRNLSAFSRFLEIAGISNGEMLNMSNIARDCGVGRLAVQGYYQILVDTLLGYFIYPFSKKVKRDIIVLAPKFYLFDVGVANYLAHQTISTLKGAAAGKALEHYILMELVAYRGIHRASFEITYWRTKSGLEVDFILGQAQVALEVKISEQVHQEDLKGLIAFCEEHPETQGIVVSLDKRARQLQVSESTTLHIMPWEVFLKNLWKGEVIA